MKPHPQTQQAYQLLHNGALALARAEQQGIRVDLSYTKKYSDKLTTKILMLEKELQNTKFYRHWRHTKRSAPNIYSNAQLAHYLYNVKKLSSPKTTSGGQGSADEESLKQLNIPELNSLLRIRKYKKLRDVYLTSFIREQVDGYIHPFFNLHLVRTFRSSSDHPNFQNIPKRDEESLKIIRRALKPRPGHQLLEIDYKALEVRVGTCYHKDQNMLKYIKNPDTDMHGDMTQEIFMLNSYNPHRTDHKYLRSATKNGFVFPQFYGDYYGNNAISLACEWGGLSKTQRWKPGEGVELEGGSLADHLKSKGIGSLNKFTKHLQNIEEDFWENRFSDYAKWKKRWWKTYQRYGYVDMLTGFRCSGVMQRNDCINYPVQGAAFHCLLWTFIAVDKRMREEEWDTKLIGQIHDAIILDVHPDELEYVLKTVQEIATQELPKAWTWINVPLEVDAEVCPVDGSWAEKESCSI